MYLFVLFGRSKNYNGIVWRLHDRRPDFKTVKTVSRVLYGTPLLDERQRRFWEWVADYYMCTLGEVMRVALPSLMKPSGHGEEEFAADEFRPRREWFVALAGEALTVESHKDAAGADLAAVGGHEADGLAVGEAIGGKALQKQVCCDFFHNKSPYK